MQAIYRTTKSLYRYFTPTERGLWCVSVLLIAAAYLLFDRTDPLTLAASLIGVTSLILCAKGNPAGQVLMIVFSLIYGVISYRSAYYGEMITYLGMTAPMALLTLIVWMRHPFQGRVGDVIRTRQTQRNRRVSALSPFGIAPLFSHASALNLIR